MFIAHTTDVSRDSFKVIEQCKNQWVLTNQNDAFNLVSNICPHQQSLISTETSKGRVCPYHGWSFDLAGNPLGSGLTECKNSSALETKPVFEWNSLLFTDDIVCPDLPEVDLSNMVLVEQRIDRVYASAITVMDLFLDVAHIPLVHKGIYEQINLNNIREVEWHLYDYGTLQKVYNDDNVLKAAWFAVYPGTMIEWQDGALFITVIVPGTDCKVIVYKYKDTTISNESYKINEGIWETAWAQDKAQAELIQGVPLKNLEKEKQHFRDWNIVKWN